MEGEASPYLEVESRDFLSGSDFAIFVSLLELGFILDGAFIFEFFSLDFCDSFDEAESDLFWFVLFSTTLPRNWPVAPEQCTLLPLKFRSHMHETLPLVMLMQTDIEKN